MGTAVSEIETIITETRRIAVVGASDDRTRPSFGVVRTLIDAGFEVVPVNPNETAVQGLPAVASLDEVGGVIDLVNVFRRPEATPQVAREALSVGARALWLQVGIQSEEAERIAVDAGLRYVEDECLGVVVDRVRARHEPIDPGRFPEVV